MTVEAMVIENAKWHELFSVDELTKARLRLKQYGYNPANDANTNTKQRGTMRRPACER